MVGGGGRWWVGLTGWGRLGGRRWGGQGMGDNWGVGRGGGEEEVGKLKEGVEGWWVRRW